MRGSKPKPTALKLLDGTRADRINHYKPAMPPASIEPPDWLDETARAHWGDLARVLQSSELLTAG
jgi:phage terminase small subunit